MVKIFVGSNGQVRVTIPKAIATALQFKHKEEVEFLIRGEELIIKRMQNDE